MRRSLAGLVCTGIAIIIACDDESIGPEPFGSIALIIVTDQPATPVSSPAPSAQPAPDNLKPPAGKPGMQARDGLDSATAADRIARSPAAATTFTRVHVRVSGPTNTSMDLVHNTTTDRWEGVISGLEEGAYAVVVEGLVDEEVDYLGSASGVQVHPSDTATATVNFNSFRPTLDDPVSPTRIFSIPVSFGQVNGASGYWVHWAPNQDFTGADSVSVSSNGTTILVGSTGTYWIRVRASSSVTSQPGRPSDPRSVDVAADTVGGSNPGSAFGLAGDLTLDSLNIDASFPEDWFALSVCQADTVSVETIAARAPVSSGLDPFLVLLDAAGDTVQADANGAGGIDARIDTFAIPSDGVYHIGVSAEGGTSGDYRLTVDTATGPNHNPNDPSQCDPLAQLVFAVQPSNDTAGSTIDPPIQVEARDDQGSLLSTFGDVVTIALTTDPTDGAATLSGTLEVNASGGVATFSDLSLDRSASGYQLVATARRATSDPSDAFDIVAAPPASVAIESGDGQTAEANTAVPLDPTVLVSDAWGNPVPGIEVAFRPTGSGTVPATADTTDTAGLATTAWTLGTAAGSESDSLWAVVAGVDSVVFVATASAGAPAQLTFVVQPSAVDENATITPPVDVAITDALGNVVTSATDAVTLAITAGTGDPSATLSGTLTVNATNGVASFGDLSIDLPASDYSLEATASGLTSATSTPFAVHSVNVVYWLGGDGNWSNASLWSDGAVPGATDTVTIDVPGNYTVTLDADVSVDQLTLGTSSGTQILNVNGFTLTVGDSLIVRGGGTGHLEVLNGGTVAAAALVVDGELLASGTVDAPIDNRGLVTVQGTAAFNAGYQSAAGSQLTLAGSDADLTVSTGFTNNGTITFTSATCCGPPQITIADGGTIDNPAGSLIEVTGQDGGWISGSLANAGTVSHSGAGDLTIQGTTIDNTGTMSASGGGGLSLEGAFTNAGAITVDSGLTLGSWGTSFTNTASGTVTLGLDATLDLESPASQFDAGFTVDSSAYVYVNGGSGGSTLSVTGNLVILTGGAIDAVNTTVTADSIVAIGDLTLDNAGINAPLHNQGLLTAQSGGGTLNGALYTTSGSTIEIAGNASLSLTAGVPFSNAGYILFSGTSGDAPSLQLSGSDMANEAGGGVVTVQNGVDATLTGIGTLVNESTIEVPSGSLTIEGSNITNNTLFDVSGGYLNLSPSTSLSNAGTLTVASGFEVAVTTPTPFANSGIIGGSGLVRPGGGLSNTGTIAPGASPGTLTIDGDLTLASGGVLQLEINGPTPDTEHDVLIVSGTLTLGGTLEVIKDGAYDPAAADTLGVVTFASSSGAFESVAGTDLGGGEILDLLTGSTDLQLARTTQVVAVAVSPGGASIAGVGSTTAFTAAALDGVGDTLSGKTFTWTSLNPNVATVDGSGTVTAVASGQVAIAVSAGGVSGYALVTVTTSGLPPVNLWVADDTTAGFTGYLVDVWGTSGADIFAVGFGGTVLHYDGGTWNSMANPGGQYQAVWGTSSDDIFAVGDGGVIAHYDGASWSSMTSPVTDALLSVWGAAPNDVFATGENGVILHDDGTGWFAMTSPTTNALTGVWGTSGSDVFAVGDAGTVVHYDGTSWTDTTVTTQLLQGVWGTAPNDVFVVDFAHNAYRYDGTNWSTQSTATGLGSYGIWGTSSSDIYSVGAGAVSHFDGSTWTPMDAGTTAYLFGGPWGSSATDVFAVGTLGTVLRGLRGATVTVTPDTTLTAIDDQVQLAASAEDAGANPISGVSFTWSSSDSSVAIPDSAGLVTALGNGTATITATAPGGAAASAAVTVQQVAVSWSTSPASGTAPSVGSSFQFTTLEVLDHNGNVVASPTFTWETLNSNVVTVDGSGTFTPVAAGQATIVTQIDDLIRYTVVTVTDPSLTPVNLWAPVGIGVTSNHLNDVWGTSGADVWAVGDGGDILHFDGGTWSVAQTGGNTLNSVWGVSDTNVLAVGNLSTILRYDGASWTPMSNPAPAGISAVWAATPEHAWAVGPAGLTLNFLNGTWSDATVNTALSLSDITGWSWGGSVLAVGSDGNGTYGVDQGAVQELSDGTWTQLPGAPEALTGLWGSWMTNVFATGNSGGLYRFDGNTWSSSGTMSGGVPLAVSGTSPTDVYAVGGNGNISRFDGSNWTPMTTGTTEQLQAVWAAPDGTVFVTGYNGTIVRGFRDATVSVTPADPTLTAIGLEVQLTAEASAGGGPVSDVTFTWSSSDSSVAVPDATGLVTALANGAATITATAPGGVSGSTTVTVDATFTGGISATSAGFGDTLVLKPDPAITWTGGEEITIGGATPYYLSRTTDSIALAVPDVPVAQQEVVISAQGSGGLVQYDSIDVTSSFTPILDPLTAPNIGNGPFPLEFYITLSASSANHYLTVAPNANRAITLAIDWQTVSDLDVYWLDQSASAYVGNFDAVTVANPESTTVAIASTDTLRLWFNFWSGETSMARVTIAASGVGTTIAAGLGHSCSVDVLGDAYCWGSNTAGQLGDGTNTYGASPQRVVDVSGLVSIVAGEIHTCALTDAGDVYCWGAGGDGQLGHGTFDTENRPVLVSGGLTFRSLSAGHWHTCGVTTADEVWCWGLGAAGQLGDGGTVSSNVPVQVPGSYLAVGPGKNHTCAIRADSLAVCWGSNEFGQLGDGSVSSSPYLSPTPVAGSTHFAAITGGSDHTCGLDASGTAYCWGENGQGQLGDGSTSTPNPSPTALVGYTFSTIDASFVHTCGVSGSTTYCWGANGSGQLGDGSISPQLSPTAVATATVFRSVSGGIYHTCGSSVLGEAYCWGRDSYGQLGDGPNPPFTAPAATSGPTLASLEVGAYNTCGISDDGSGTAYCWGYGGDGSLGNGTTADALTPTTVVGGLTFTSISAPTFTHTCGTVTGDTTAYCWGRGPNGELGNGAVGNTDYPVGVLGGLSFTTVTAGSFHSCGITTDSLAYCWGRGSLGRLGDGTTANRSQPTNPVGMPGSNGRKYTQISAGNAFVCGIAENDEAYCWGANSRGTLGDGTFENDSLPRLVAGGYTWKQVRAGWTFACGITMNDDAYCWGLNGNGQLGDGGVVDTSNVPVPVAGGLKFTSLQLSIYNTCGVTTDGAVYCWGRNQYGELGNGELDSGYSATPVQVYSSAVFLDAGGGSGFSCGLSASHVVYCWGESAQGQLGNGTLSYSTTPVQATGGHVFRSPIAEPTKQIALPGRR